MNPFANESAQPLISTKKQSTNYVRLAITLLFTTALIVAGVYYFAVPSKGSPQSVIGHQQFIVADDVDSDIDVVDDKKGAMQCETGGCSGEICAVGASSMMSTCDYKCEYGCLKFQKCKYSKKKKQCGFKTMGPAKNDYKQCMAKCTCSLPSETGPGKAAFTRYYYNSKSGECESFTYGGFGGNDNNFDSMKKCERTCKN